jgi:hypothetical protein
MVASPREMNNQFEFSFEPRNKFRSTDPLTSVVAAFANLPLKDTQRRRILEVHMAHPDGLTNDEMDQLGTGIVLQSLNTRVSELHRGGWLEDTGLTRLTRHGIQAVVWRITQKALNYREHLGISQHPGRQ